MKTVVTITGQRVCDGEHWVAYVALGDKVQQLGVVATHEAETQLEGRRYVGERARISVRNEAASIKEITGFSFKPENVGQAPTHEPVCLAPKKNRHETQADAVAAIARILRKNQHNDRKLPLRTYLCPGCHFWHLTSKPDNRKVTL